MDYKHTAKVSSDSWFITFYCWLWWVEDKNSLDFCKLFWGYLLAIPNLIIRVIFFPVYILIARPLIKREERRAAEEEKMTFEEYKANKEIIARKKESRERRAQSFFAKIGHFFALKPVRVVLGAVAILGLAIIAFGAGYLIFLFIKVIIDNFTVSLLVALGIAVVCIIVFALMYMIVRFLETDAADTLFTGLKGGKHTFTGAIRHGYEGIKTNTCPKIELTD